MFVITFIGSCIVLGDGYLSACFLVFLARSIRNCLNIRLLNGKRTKYEKALTVCMLYSLKLDVRKLDNTPSC